MSRIRVTIDRIVLGGLGVAERTALVQSLQDELRDILSDPAKRAQWVRSHRTPVLRLGRVPLRPGPAAARSFGSQLAHSIGKGLKP